MRGQYLRLVGILSALTFAGVWLLMEDPQADAAATAPPARYVYYPNCTAAWNAGAAPIYYGEPGYRSGMDGDGDGIACEPIRY